MKAIHKILFLFGVVGICGCDSWLDVKPADRITEEQVFHSEKGFHSALNGIYIELIKPELYGASLSGEMIEMLGQRYQVKEENTNYKLLTEFKYTEEYPKDRLQSVWDAVYKLILDCNIILNNAEVHRDVLTDQGYAVIKGEALALRAFLHFDMLRLFGPVMAQNPAEKSIPYSEKISVSASPLLPADSLIRYKIIRDLKVAEDLLLKADPVVTEGPQMTEQTDNTYAFRPLRMNYYAVLALQARVHLYAGDRVDALRYARMLIDDPKREDYFPFTGYAEIKGNENNPDRVFSSGMLFGLLNTEREEIYKNYFDPENAANNLLEPREKVIENLFTGEEADYRYLPVWKPSVVPGDRCLVCTRFKKSKDHRTYDYLMPLIRVSEMYLIAAECCENEEDAYIYLNTLRNHRGLTDTKDNLAARLTNEYIKEFVCEGQLFFYYKRKNITSLKSGHTGKDLTMGASAYVPPLPPSESRYRNE